MSYKDRLQQGSFRGVQFDVQGHTFQGGNRIAKHEFPERDEPSPEHLGRKGRIYTLDCHIIGEDYFGQRNALMRTFEQGKKGVLIHPWLGRQDVQCETFTMNESILEGRIVQFSVTFIEEGRKINPSGFFSEIFEVFDQINATIDSLQTDFEAAYDVINFPGDVFDSAVGVLNNATDTFTEALGIVPATTSAIDGLRNDILDFSNAIPSVATDAATTFIDTVTLQRTLTQITNESRDKQKIQGFMLDFGDDDDEVPINTPTRVQEKANNDAIYRVVQGIAVIDIVKWFTMSVSEQEDITDDEQRDLENTTVKSVNDLEERRDEVVTVIQDYVSKFSEADSTTAFNDLQAVMLNALPQAQTTLELKREIPITPKATTNSLVLSYDNFDNIRSETDFIDRNKVRHPAFVTGGETYEIVEVA